MLWLFANLASGQTLKLHNEEVLFSFQTIQGKIALIARDTLDQYLIYRFGKTNAIEVEFPEKTKESWSRFSYSYYFRGGGAGNEGLDLNYLYFIRDDFKYVLYDVYYAVTDKQEVGIKVINLKDSTTTILKGKLKTLKGSLINFRGNELVKEGEEMFD